jgi:hypothetical protein
MLSGFSLTQIGTLFGALATLIAVVEGVRRFLASSRRSQLIKHGIFDGSG